MSTNFEQWNNAAVNQESDAEYAASSQRIGGAVDDTPFPAKLANKLFYQLTTFVAAFGAMMSAKGYANSDADVNVLQAVLGNLLTQADQQPAILNMGYSPTPFFNAGAANGFQMALAGNITSSTIAGVTPGQLVAFYFLQDGVGGRTVAWPPSVTGASQPDPAANALSLFLFRADAGGVLRAATPAVSTNGLFIAGGITASAIMLLSGAPAGSVLVGDGTSFVAKSRRYQNLTGVRGYGTQYQNTTGASITVCVTGMVGSAGGAMTAYIGTGSASNEAISQSRVPAASSNPIENVGLTFEVPTGWFYRVDSFNLALQNWAEYDYV